MNTINEITYDIIYVLFNLFLIQSFIQFIPKQLFGWHIFTSTSLEKYVVNNYNDVAINFIIRSKNIMHFVKQRKNNILLYASVCVYVCCRTQSYTI